MFDVSDIEWNHNRAKTITNYYGYSFFKGKKVLDLGAGHGELAAAFLRLGADVTCVDARDKNLKEIKKNLPSIKTLRLDLEHEWPFQQYEFDIVMSCGIMCHLKNYEQHIKNICNVAEYIVLETEVLDDPSPDKKIIINEDNILDHLSYHGEGSIVSAINIQNKLSALGATYKRIDNTKTNSGCYKYDWKETGAGVVDGHRRIWFIRRDRFIAQKIENRPKIVEAEKQVEKVEEVIVARLGANTANAANSYAKVLARVEQQKIREEQQKIREEQRQYNSPPVRLSPLLHRPGEKSVPRINIDHNYFIHTAKKSIDNPDCVIRIFCNENNDKNINDLNVVLVNGVSFNDFFQKINSISGPNDINIICSSHIFFDDTISLAHNIKHKEVYALTCWDWYSSERINFRNRSDSQDTWIVRGKIENVFGAFSLNDLCSDNRIAYEFHKHGYEIVNPSKSIKTYYDCSSGVKNRINSVSGPHLFILPTEMI